MAGARGATPCRRERHRARGLEYDNDGNRVLRERVSNWSDQLMMFILRARRPEVYRANLHANHVGNIAHLVTVSLIGGAQPSRLHGLSTHQLQSRSRDVHTSITGRRQQRSTAGLPDVARPSRDTPNPGLGLCRGALCTPLAKIAQRVSRLQRTRWWAATKPSR